MWRTDLDIDLALDVETAVWRWDNRSRGDEPPLGGPDPRLSLRERVNIYGLPKTYRNAKAKAP